MHRKRVTSELHDSYFRLMTIKHSISKIHKAIVWALSYYLTQVSLGPRAVASRLPDSQRPDVVGKATPDRGGPRKPPIEWTPRPLVEHLREQERHNATVITVGSKYEVYVQSPASSHMQPFNNPFEPLQ